MTLLSLKPLKDINNSVNELSFTTGKNLFSKFDAQTSTHLATDGSISSNEIFFTTGYVRVLEGHSYHVSDYVSTSIVCFYDKNLAYISGNSISSNVIPIPNGCHYIRVANNVTYVDIDTYQIEIGTVATEYESYKKVDRSEKIGAKIDLLQKSSDRIDESIQGGYGYLRNLSRNIFNKNSKGIVTNSYLDSAGNEIASQNIITDYMEVLPQKHYVANITVSTAFLYIAFYDHRKKLISTKSLDSVKTEGFTTPDNCYYVRMTVNHLEDLDKYQVEMGSYPSIYRPYGFNEAEQEKIQLTATSDLIDYNRLFGGLITLEGVFSPQVGNFKVTDYIRVIEGNYYKYNAPSSQMSIAFYNEWKEVVSLLPLPDIYNDKGIFQIPSGVKYMRVSINLGFNPKLTNLFYNYTVENGEVVYSTSTKNSNDWFLKPLIDNQNFKTAYGDFFPRNYKLIAVNEGHCMFYDSAAKKLLLSRNIEECYANNTIIDVTTLTNIGSGSIIHGAIFRNDSQLDQISVGDSYIYILITNNSKIYYAELLGGSSTYTFAESKIWNLPGNIPQLDTSETQGIYKGLKVLGEVDGTPRLSYFDFLNSNFDNHTASGSRRFIFGSYTGVKVEGGGATNVPYGAVPTCLFSTTDGKDFYVDYMFGFSGRRFKKAGETSTTSYPRYRFGEDIDTSLFAAYSGGLKAKVRLNIVPSSKEINPVNKFEYLSEINITSASQASKGVFELESTSDIAVGDCLCITGSSNDEWDSLLNNTASETSGGNGKFFMVTSVDGNNVTLATCVGNPDNPLFCTHIHAANKGLNGTILSTGEEYPESWVVFVDSYRKSGGIPYNYRLNSSELGLSRSCGIVVNPDNTVLYGADTATGIYADNLVSPEGRTEKLSMSPLGVWKFNLSDIDDHTKYKLMVGNVFSIYHLRKINHAIYASAQGGDVFLSLDNGETFEQILSNGNTYSYYLGCDKEERRFYFTSSTEKNHNRGEILIIELK